MPVGTGGLAPYNPPGTARHEERGGREGVTDGRRAASRRPPAADGRRHGERRDDPGSEVILGIDPGTATMGWGVVRKDGASKVRYVQHGAITTPPGWPMPRRLSRLFDGVEALLTGYQPVAIAIEELFFGKNVTSGISVGQARGVVLLAAHRAGIPLYEYKPSQVKQAVTSSGRADKRQVQEMVKTLLGLPEIPKPDDAADGLAIAMTCAFTSRQGHRGKAR